MKKIVVFLLIVVFSAVGVAMATSISDIVSGVNITKYDGDSDGSNSGWHSTNEDQEVEPGCLTGQVWDLEATYWNSSTSTLYLVGGFDFVNGYSGWDLGDLFLFGSTYDYVLDFARDSNGHLTGNYNVYRDTHGNLETSDVYYNINDIPSNPYARDDQNSNDTDTGVSGNYVYYSDLDDGLGITGGAGSHYVLEISLASLLSDDDFLPGMYETHITLECGNDAMKGNLPVPEPATVLLLGLGLLGLGLGTKKRISD